MKVTAEHIGTKMILADNSYAINLDTNEDSYLAGIPGNDIPPVEVTILAAPFKGSAKCFFGKVHTVEFVHVSDGKHVHRVINCFKESI